MSASVNKYKRLLKLVDLLQPPGKTKPYLAGSFGKSIRSIERDLNDLEEEGFCIEKDKAGRHFIFRTVGRDTTILLSHEESEFLNDLLNTAAAEHPLTIPLKTKLFYHAGLGRWTKNYIKRNVAEVIQNLTDAMKVNCKVQISEYYSASLGKRIFRELEPMMFSDNYRYLIAFEAGANKFVNLKMDRIAGVELLNDKCQRKPNAVKLDVFHMAGNDESHKVKLLMTPLAARLMREEHPSTEHCFTDSGDEDFPFLFEATVHNYLPLGRHCMGLSGHVKVVGPDDFVLYLKSRMKDFLW